MTENRVEKLEKLVVRGGQPLRGSLHIAGAKNAVLPILAATLLTDKTVELSNLPHLYDVTTTLDLLNCLGSHITVNPSMGVSILNNNIRSRRAPPELVQVMRASILVLGPLVARYGEGIVALPGGCAIGSRPINLHLDGLTALGAEFSITDEAIVGKAPTGLHGNSYQFDTISVTGTENLIMAATLAKGRTTLQNCACEPEVVDLVHFLRAMGALIQGEGTSEIIIDGVDSLSGCSHTIMPDRIETGTYLVAVAIAGGDVIMHNTSATTVTNIVSKLLQSGCEIDCLPDTIHIRMNRERPRSIDLVTEPYPGFPTDMQAQFIALNSFADGNAKIKETVFDNRFMHVKEMQRMGADIRLQGNTAYVHGKYSLHGATVQATDLRASASLVLMGLGISDVTTISSIHHIDRGYESIEEKLAKVGADIARLPH